MFITKYGVNKCTHSSILTGCTGRYWSFEVLPHRRFTSAFKKATVACPVVV